MQIQYKKGHFYHKFINPLVVKKKTNKNNSKRTTPSGE